MQFGLCSTDDVLKIIRSGETTESRFNWVNCVSSFVCNHIIFQIHFFPFSLAAWDMCRDREECPMSSITSSPPTQMEFSRESPLEETDIPGPRTLIIS